MQHPHTGQVRFIMRQEKTRTIVADHDVIEQAPYCMLRPDGNNTCLAWTAQDMTNNELRDESFTLKFSGPEVAGRFAQEFNKAKDLSSRKPNSLGDDDMAAAAAATVPSQVAASARNPATGIAAGTGSCEAACCDAVLQRDGVVAAACTTMETARDGLPEGVGGIFATANSKSIDNCMLEKLWQGIHDCQQRTMQAEEWAQKADERARRAEEQLGKMSRQQQQRQQKESELEQLVQKLLRQHSDDVLLVKSLQSDLDQERQQLCSLEANVHRISMLLRDVLQTVEGAQQDFQQLKQERISDEDRVALAIGTIERCTSERFDALECKLEDCYLQALATMSTRSKIGWNTLTGCADLQTAVVAAAEAAEAAETAAETVSDAPTLSRQSEQSTESTDSSSCASWGLHAPVPKAPNLHIDACVISQHREELHRASSVAIYDDDDDDDDDDDEYF